VVVRARLTRPTCPARGSNKVGHDDPQTSVEIGRASPLAVMSVPGARGKVAAETSDSSSQLWLRDEGFRVAGRDPIATFLVAVSRAPELERVGTRAGDTGFMSSRCAQPDRRWSLCSLSRAPAVPWCRQAAPPAWSWSERRLPPAARHGRGEGPPPATGSRPRCGAARRRDVSRRCHGGYMAVDTCWTALGDRLVGVAAKRPPVGGEVASSRHRPQPADAR
jgi:hypothetical protein